MISLRFPNSLHMAGSRHDHAAAFAPGHEELRQALTDARATKLFRILGFLGIV